MNFEILENFEWYNEPENVRFEGDAMVVYPKVGTGFWQSIHRGYKRDNGHFFFCRKNGDFSISLGWRVGEIIQFAENGIMLRIDERNWFKATIEKETSNDFIITSSLTQQGHSDWAKTKIESFKGDIWFRLVKIGDEYEVFYSVDGNIFTKFRMFYLPVFEDVKVGAYISSLEDETNSQLLDIFLDNPF